MQKLTSSALRVLMLAACAHAAASVSSAQSYPAKPIRVLVGFSVGGSTDVTARLVAQKVSDNVGQTVLVENRPGASGSIAIERVLAAPADGYTLIMISASATVEPALHTKLAYDLQRDLAPISLVTIGPYVLVVHPSVPAHNVKELIALARSRPNSLSYGSDGIGSSLHLAGALLTSMANVKMTHVPYKGGADNAIANASGQIDASFPSVASALPYLASAKIRPLAVTHTRRSSLLPAVPTIDESGLPGYDRLGWYGLLAPARVPQDVVTRMSSIIDKAVNTAQMKDLLKKQGLEAQTNTPEKFAEFIATELARNAKLVKAAGLVSD